METLNLIAQGFGYSILAAMILMAIWIWRAMKQAPRYEDYEGNRLMGLSDMVEVLEKEKAQWLLDKEALEMEIDKQEAEKRILEKANEDLKGEKDLAQAQYSAAKLTLGALYDKHAALLTAHKGATQEIVDLRLSIKCDIEALNTLTERVKVLESLNKQYEAKLHEAYERLGEVEEMKIVTEMAKEIVNL